MAERNAPSHRAATRLAWGLWALGMLLAVLGQLLVRLNGGALDSPIVGQAQALIALTVGALIVSRRPANRIGWLFLVCTLLLAFGGAGNLADQYAQYALVTGPGVLPGAAWAVWLGTMAQITGFYPLVSFLLLLFPDGRLPSPRWRPVGWVAAIFIGLAELLIVFDARPSTAAGLQVDNPLGPLVAFAAPAQAGPLAPLFSVVTFVAGLAVVQETMAPEHVTLWLPRPRR